MSSYATVADLASLANNNAAIASITSADQQRALDAASDEFDGYFAAQYHLPLVSWPQEVRQHVCDVAAYRLMKRRGFSQEGDDDTFREAFDDAWKWARAVAQGLISPPGIVDSSSATREGAPSVTTGQIGNTVGGNVSPSVQLGKAKAYPFGNITPGQRGW